KHREHRGAAPPHDHGKASRRDFVRRPGSQKENHPNRRGLRSKNACRYRQGSGSEPLHPVKGRSLCVFLSLWLLPACGREGPPLPPFIRIPESVKDLSVVQSGHDLVLTWTNPGKNIDGSAATNLAHVQIRSDGATVASLNVIAPGQPQSYAIPLGSNLSGRRAFRLLVDTTEGKTSQ